MSRLRFRLRLRYRRKKTTLRKSARVAWDELERQFGSVS